MAWWLIQLTSWAEKHAGAQDLAREVAATVRVVPTIYYPVIEDSAGKHNTPYSEYVFIYKVEEIDVIDLEKNVDYFKHVLRNRDGTPVVVPDNTVTEIQAVMEEKETLKTGDHVKVNSGPFRGNRGVVTNYDPVTQMVVVHISIGEERHDTVISRDWVRRVKPRGA